MKARASAERPTRPWLALLSQTDYYAGSVLKQFATLSALFLGLALIGPSPRAVAGPKERAYPAEHGGKHGKAAKRSTKKPKKSESAGARRTGGSERAATRRAQKLGLGTVRAAGKLLAGRPEPEWVKAAGGDTLPGTLRFPVRKGWYVRGFGSGEGGYHQAMDIGGEVGWNVRAAASGIVGYAGDDISGYGNLVLLIHPGGWVTAYAHNSQNKVVAGQLVTGGDVIAELGSTGRSRGPHVHFELLHRGENCDPAPLFRPAAERRNGKRVPVERAVWKQPRKRPRAVACHPRKKKPQAPPDADLVDRTNAD